MAEVADAAGKTTIKSADPTTVAGINVDNAIKAVPFVGSAVTVGKDVGAVGKQLAGGVPDGGELALGVTTVATDVTGFIQSSSQTIIDIATDPLGWLIGQGLNFLITAVQPIQDAIHFVSGDGPALGIAAENFNAIAKGLQELAVNFAAVADESLVQWQGDAGAAAKTTLGEFANGINGVAAKSGDLAQMLQLNSMLMSFIEDLIKAILTELITWLIMIWLPALAAAVPTFGASTAAAGTASTVKVGSTTVKTTGKVNKLRKILDDVIAWLKKLKDKLAQTKFGEALMKGKTATAVQKAQSKNAGKGAVDKLFASKGMLGKRYEKAGENLLKTEDGAVRINPTLAKTGATEILKKGREATFKGVLGFDPTNPGENAAKTVNDHLGKLNSHTKNAKKASDYGDPGEEQTDDETRKDLDF